VIERLRPWTRQTIKAARQAGELSQKQVCVLRIVNDFNKAAHPFSLVRSVLNLGGVYYIECAGAIKIGWTNNIGNRMSALQCGSPEPLCLLHLDDTLPRSAESALHRLFARHRVSGEWFDAVDEIYGFVAYRIAAARDEYNIEHGVGQ